jgi:DNA (cytosine-5)-methyltransferase 1
LDGITFPRWRIESIKAYGNAVVPPLIYTIFKAIDELRSKDSASSSGAG